MKEVSCVSDADASYRGKGDVCMSERRYSNDPKEILIKADYGGNDFAGTMGTLIDDATEAGKVHSMVSS